MIIDICSYNGESDLFEIRYNILKDHVDEFRVIEFDKTFSGKPKKMLFNKEYEKVKNYYVVEEMWSKYKDLAFSSPNTEYGKGASNWITEFCMKESLKDFLTDLQDDDILFIGDCDEIWNPVLSTFYPKKTHKLGLKVYSYYLNNESSEEFYGPIFTQYKFIKNKCLNHVRSQESYFLKIPQAGWHFTSQGGYKKVKQKLTDSYTAESYAPPAVLNNLEENIKNNKDFLGRNFTYEINEDYWPDYLKRNKDKYKHLCL